MAELASQAQVYPWQRTLMQETLARANDQKLPHALLLAGPAGIGKQAFALALAQALLCESPSDQGGCGQCQGCKLTEAGSHPDRFLLVPEADSKSQTIRIHQIRDLVEFSVRTPQYGGYRVAVLMPADAINRNAQNALLKTLEEPGQKTLMLLVSDQPSMLLPTVRSRCQQQLLPLPAADLALEWLQQQDEAGKEAAALLQAAGGAPLRALQLASSSWFGHRADLLRTMLQAMQRRLSPSAAASRFLAHDAREVLALLASWIHLALQLQSGREVALDPTLEAGLQHLAKAPSARLLAGWESLQDGRRKLLSGANPNAELLLEKQMLVLAGVDSPATAF